MNIFTVKSSDSVGSIVRSSGSIVGSHGSLVSLHLYRLPPQAFAKQAGESFQEDEAPFVVKNRLGLPVSVLYSEMFSPIGREVCGHTVELQDGESLNMDYLRSTTDSDQFSAMTSLCGKDYSIQPSKWQGLLHIY